MQRKVIQIANSTQLISLPRKWVLQHGVKKGDCLDIKENGNQIIVSTQSFVKLNSTEVDVLGMDRDSLMFFVRALYKNGYDEIKLNFNTPLIQHIRLNTKVRTIDVISKEISRLPGMDIFSNKENYCIIKTISEDSPKALDNMIRRIFLMTLETLNDMHDGWKSNSSSILDSIQLKHDNITKFIAYSQRIINKVGCETTQKNCNMYHILEEIDEILDLIKFNARMLSEYNIKSSNEALKIYKKIIESFETCSHLFYKFDPINVTEINTKRYEILGLVTKSLKNFSKKELSILAYMEQISEKIINLVNSTMSMNN